MVNETLDAVTIKLYELFGDKYKIYTNGVRQGLKKPCFIVFVKNSDVTRLLGKRKILNNSIVIHYIPKSDDKSELHEVFQKLAAGLEFIVTTNNNMLMGTDIEAAIENDGEGEILHFFINYNFTLLEGDDEKNYMEELTQERRIEDE